MNPLTQDFSFTEIQPVSSNTSHRTSPTVLKIYLSFHSGFPGGSVGKKLPVNVGDSGLIPGSRRSPGEGSDNHSSVLAGKSHGGRSLAGYSPWG